jgi:hypothetical protein
VFLFLGDWIMLRVTPPLVYYDKVDGTYIKVGTGSWQHWLNENRSFRYESFWGSFTAYKEHRGEEIVWYANRCVKEQLRRADLGESRDLTLNKLIDTAKQLSDQNTTYWELKSQTHQIFETQSFDTKEISKEVELLHQISELQEHISELQKQLDQERLFQASPHEPVKFIWN